MNKPYSRSDYITDLASSRTHAALHGRHHSPASAIPDLRFEPTFMKKISPYVHVHRSNITNAKGEEVVRVEWSKVLWVTTRDQILSPFIQGALWYVADLQLLRLLHKNLRLVSQRGTASIFLHPLLLSLRAQLSQWWPAYRQPPAGHEGRGAGWLRNWAHSLFGSVSTVSLRS